jgi:SpoIIAA-like
MMESLSGYPNDMFAAVWHDPGSAMRGDLPIADRDRIVGPHDVRMLAKYTRGADPVSSTERMEHTMLGMGQWRDFGRIAIITDERWMRQAVQFFAPFFHGPVRVFANAQAEYARTWVQSHDHH